MARLPIVMPKLGLTMTEGVLAEWSVAPGDRVKAGDVIFVVETDKISNEIEATADAVVETLHVQAGDLVPVGELVATFVVEGEVGVADGVGTKGEGEVETVLEPASVAEQAPQPAPDVSPQQIAEGTRLIVTPLARRIATEAGIDIASLTGSGPRGRIMADDVTTALSQGPTVKAVAEPAPAKVALPTSAAPSDRGILKPFGQFQKVTARRLTESKQEIPHFYVFADADVTDLLDLRGRLNVDATFGKVTVNHFLITAVARALAGMPQFNCVWTPEGLLELARVDVGFAIEGPKGLVAPVLRDLGGCGVDEVAQAATALVNRARNGRFAPDELQGGAITISNVGMFGATGLLPIINPGQSSILGVGANQPQYRPDADGRPILRQIMTLSLSCDHRVIDGAIAARFLQSIQTGLEAPLSLVRRPLRGPDA